MNLPRLLSTASKDLLRATALGLLMLAASFPAPALEAPSEVMGSWKFSAVLDGVDITSIDETQAQNLVGKIMVIRSTGIQFNGQKCGTPSFESQRVQPKSYLLREAGIGAAKLKLPNPVTVFDLGCTRIFMLKRHQGVIFWDGFFFRAERLK